MSGWTFLLATPGGEDLSGLLYIGALVLLSLLGSIFGKKKKEQEPKEGPPLRQTPPRPQPTRQKRPPARPTERPPVARPAPRQMEPPASIQPTPPRPAPARPARRLTREEIVRQQRGRESQRAMPAAAVKDEPPKPPGEQVAPPSRPMAPAPQTASVSDRLAFLMRDRTTLQAGLVLSEILGPPAALRNRPDR